LRAIEIAGALGACSAADGLAVAALGTRIATSSVASCAAWVRGPREAELFGKAKPLPNLEADFPDDALAIGGTLRKSGPQK